MQEPLHPRCSRDRRSVSARCQGFIEDSPFELHCRTRLACVVLIPFGELLRSKSIIRINGYDVVSRGRPPHPTGSVLLCVEGERFPRVQRYVRLRTLRPAVRASVWPLQGRPGRDAAAPRTRGRLDGRQAFHRPPSTRPARCFKSDAMDTMSSRLWRNTVVHEPAVAPFEPSQNSTAVYQSPARRLRA